jgi:hypothetical protein
VGTSKIGAIPTVRVFNTTATSVLTANGAGPTFNSEVYDVGGLHDNVTNNGRLTAPVTGVYEITAYARWSSNGAGARQMGISASSPSSGGDYIASAWQPAVVGGFPTDQSVSTLWKLQAGEYVTLSFYQDSGATLTAGGETTGPHFAMTWVAPG